MGFSVYLCQRKSCNKHLRLSIHVSHTSFIPPLVAKNYAPCDCHARTFLVLLVMSPVNVICVFVHPIYTWKKIHVWMQICSEWNEGTLDGSRCLALMYGQALGWSYVITPGMSRLDKQCWQQASESRHVQERILIPCCICSWHARDLRISTQITVPKPESHGSCSQLKAYSSDRISERRKGHDHRRWEDQWWLNTPCIRVGFIANIAQQSFPIGMSSPNYSSCVEENIYRRNSSVSWKVSIDFFVTSPMSGIYINKTTSSSKMCIHYSRNGLGRRAGC
jgi:hypothetical protein